MPVCIKTYKKCPRYPFFGYTDTPIPKIVQIGVVGKAYPSNNQIHPFFMQQFGNVRVVWNMFLHLLQNQYKNRKSFCKKHHIDFTKMSKNKRNKVYNTLPIHLQYPGKTKLKKILFKMLSNLKKDSSYHWLRKSDSTSLQITIERLIDDIEGAKHGKNHAPKRKHRAWTQSYTTDSNSINTDKFWVKRVSRGTYYIKVPKLKTPLKVHFNYDVMNLADSINRMTITMESTGNFKISLNIDTTKMFFNLTGRAVGIDVNLHPLLALSTGQMYKNKRYYKYYDHKLRIWTNKRSRRHNKAKKIISQNKKLATDSHSYKGNLRLHYFEFPDYMKAKDKVAKIYRKVVNCTNNRLQQITTSLVRRFDIICIEDIKVSQLTHNHNLARAIEHAGWYRFRTMLQYKCAWYGKCLVIVNKNNTTRCCWYCHTNNGKKVAQLGVEHWKCCNKYCPFHNKNHNRDTNAAINILLIGLGILQGGNLQPIKNFQRDLISRQVTQLIGRRLGTSRKVTAYTFMCNPVKQGSIAH